MKYNFIITYSRGPVQYTSLHKFDYLNISEPLKFSTVKQPVSLNLILARKIWEICNSNPVYIKNNSFTSDAATAKYKIVPMLS